MTTSSQQPQLSEAGSPDAERTLSEEPQSLIPRARSNEVGKKIVPRTKEKPCYVERASARANTLCKRKRTLFNKAMMLHVTTKAEVLIIIDKGKQRHVCGSDSIMKQYEDGELKPRESDKMYKENLVNDLEDGEVNLAVCPLESTPDKLELDSDLAGVLGHGMESTATENPNTARRPRSQRSIDMDAALISGISEPVRQLLERLSMTFTANGKRQK